MREKGIESDNGFKAIISCRCSLNARTAVWYWMRSTTMAGGPSSAATAASRWTFQPVATQLQNAEGRPGWTSVGVGSGSVFCFFYSSSDAIPLACCSANSCRHFRRRKAKRRVDCVANLKQIGLAMEAYHQKYGRFPPSFVPDKKGTPEHSWRVMLLPFLGETELYGTTDSTSRGTVRTTGR